MRWRLPDTSQKFSERHVITSLPSIKRNVRKSGILHSNVAVGERVKVTYTKLPNGNKATTIEPDHGMK